LSIPPFDPYRALEVLTRHGVKFIVIGAFAAVTQGYPLPTQDLDVTPNRDDENLQRLAGALRELHAELRLPRDETLAFQLDATFLAKADSWTLMTAAGPLDIIFHPAGTAGYADLRRDAIDETIRGTQVQLASLRDVIRMKETSNRLKDQAQLPALRETLEVVRQRERERR
jgi:hypothetical protein